MRFFIDQYGKCHRAATVRELRQNLGGRCSKMYVDKKDGTTVHIGYVVGQLWLTEVQRVERAA